MSAASRKSKPKKSRDIPNAIGSQESAAGPTHFDSLEFQAQFGFGLEAAHANPFRASGKDSESKTSATSGPLSQGSSESVALQSSMENRLRVRLAGRGSPEYGLIWKRWDMPSGPPICAQRASGRRTSGSGCSGWPMPQTMDTLPPMEYERRLNHPGRPGRTVSGNLREVVTLAGWPTPCQQDGPKGGPNQGEDRLPTAAQVAGWPTATARDWRDGRSNQHEKNARPLNEVAVAAVSGPTPAGSPAETAKQGAFRLNPAFSLYLMGYPLSWAMSGFRAILKLKGKFADYRLALLRSLEE